MTEVDLLTAITSVIQDVGIWAVFLYLFLDERKEHRLTQTRHQADLREVAGMRSRLERVQTTVALMKDTPTENEL